MKTLSKELLDKERDDIYWDKVDWQEEENGVAGIEGVDDDGIEYEGVGYWAYGRVTEVLEMDFLDS